MIAALATLSTQLGMGTSWLAAGWARPRPAAISAKLKVVLITCHKLTNNIWSEHYRPSLLYPQLCWWQLSPQTMTVQSRNICVHRQCPHWCPAVQCPLCWLGVLCPLQVRIFAGVCLTDAGCCCWCLVAADESWAMLECAGVAQWAVVVVAAGWAQLGWADQYSATARQSVYTWL